MMMMMMMMKKGFLICLCLLCLCLGTHVSANNLQISNVTLVGSFLNFSLSWDNSWRTSTTAPYNYDAVWIFVKYRDCGTLQWSHANIDSASAVSPLRTDTTADQKGVMVYRASNGVGNISNVNVSVRMAGLPSGNFDFNVFGVEMVYVPQDSFYLGDGSSTNTMRTGTNNALPYRVVSESVININNAGVDLFAGAQMAAGTLPIAYPKGYGAFYLMKYEISQEQYADFLNTLTSTQAAARYNVSAANRYTLTSVWPTIAATSGNRAIIFLSWDDYLTYLDWAALRPFTELEFEKACRGKSIYVPDEYAWGTSLIVDANTAVNDGTATETVSNAIPPGNGIANYNNSTILGPLRNGYAGTATTNRLQIGATYYGICEMSGNSWEYVVTAGNTTGRAFIPQHGDGAITPVGLSNVAGWPVTLGNGIRGGSWINPATDLRTSDRSFAVYSTNTRINTIGGRGARN
jgi:formylglycine-generating enzyme required for sulfatase activity